MKKNDLDMLRKLSTASGVSGYEQDVCMNCGCQLDPKKPKQLYDCETPADWWKLYSEEASKVVACPKEYELWTKFVIEWLGDLICRDRGWAIKNNDIDLWVWYWNDWVNKMLQERNDSREWYVLYE